MANETRRLKPAQIEEDKGSFAGLKTISNYAPANSAYTVAATDAALAELDSAQVAEAQAEAALATARDRATAAEWNLHNQMLGSKDQVTAQFGRDSNEVQALRLKKTSEYNAPKKRAKKGDPTK